MTAISGTNIAAPVVPFTTDDVYPTHKALYGEGGWRTVITLEDRDNIPDDRKEEGMVVWVADELLAYILKDDEWQELKDLLVPPYALKETVSCFFPGSPPNNSVLIWTAGIDTNFGKVLDGVGNVTTNPSGVVTISVLDADSSAVAAINIDASGVFSFVMMNPSVDLVVPAGKYLRFMVTASNTAIRNVSFTIIGQRTSLT